MDTIGYTIRLPERLHGQLKQVARDQHRSLNAQIVHLLATGILVEAPDVAAKQSLDSESDPTSQPASSVQHGEKREA